MFVIGMYDVNQKRVGKVKKVFDRYMFWTQNSVFEGELTPVQFAQLKRDLAGIINEEEDQVIFYELGNHKWLNKDVMGKPFDESPANIV